MVDAIRGYAKEHHSTIDEATRQARTYLREIVPKFNLLAYYRIGAPLARAIMHFLYRPVVEHKTLREYSVPFDLRRMDPSLWVSGTKNCWDVGEKLDGLRHFRLVNGRHLKAVLRRDPFERRVGGMLQYRKPRALIEKQLARLKRKK